MTPALRHDLQSALGSITMAIDVLRAVHVRVDQQHQWFDIIKRNADTALALLEKERSENL